MKSHEWVLKQLAAFLDGKLAGEETEAVAKHLGECPQCQRRLAELRSVEATYARRSEEGPSDAYRQSLVEEIDTAPEPRRFDLVTVEQLAQLKEFRSEHYPVLSLYLDVTPPERQGRKHLAKLKSLVTEAQERLAANRPEQVTAFEAEAAHLQAWLEHGYDGTGQGLAVFSSREHGLWRAFRLPVPVRDRLLVEQSPYIRPLVGLADEYERYAVLLVDKRAARLFVVYLGEIEEYAEFMDQIPPRPRAGKWAAQRYQRRHDVHVLWHVKKAVELLERFFVAKACDWLVIGGTTEPLAQLRTQLPPALQDRLAGEISVSLSAETNEVLAQLLEIEQETERRVEAERVEELITATCKGGPAVLAVEDTLMSLTEGRVMVLIVEAGYTAPGFECRNCRFLTTVEHPSCPVCGASMGPVVDVVEGAVERALDQQAQIEVVRGEERVRLAEHGHIGALLRY